jgi:hypothetical protein
MALNHRIVPSLAMAALSALFAAASGSEPVLSPRNTEAPFCYVRGGTRTWPVLERALPEGAVVVLSVPSGSDARAQGENLELPGISASLTPDGMLRIQSTDVGATPSFTLNMSVQSPDGATESQALTMRPAPPNRPLSYYADFGDDLIRIFSDSKGQFQPIEKGGFDQYFRRLQMQGISRLIVWLTPFPTIADPANYREEEWNRYEGQARAIVESEELGAVLAKLGRYADWGWIRQLCALRLMREFGPMLSESAVQHGIALTVSYRPFEAALTKYYEIPVFDHNGEFLWWFLPMATPGLNYRTEEFGFAHYRTVLTKMGHADMATLDTIEFVEPENVDGFLGRVIASGDSLVITASDYPPLQEESFVLQRQEDLSYALRPYGEIQDKARSRTHVVRHSLSKDEEGRLRITGLDIPERYRYIMLTCTGGADESPHCKARGPVKLYAKAGNRLGRTNTYWVLDEPAEARIQTRVAGIPPHGSYYSEFRATEESRKLVEKGPDHLPLSGRTLVIDRGTEWTVERLDFNRQTARDNAVAELKSILDYPAFDEIFINTRSHTALISYINLGYAPISAANDPRLRELTGDAQSVEQMTTFAKDEWQGFCRSPESPFPWRYARNRETANGVRRLLESLEGAFPGTRIRAVIPPGEEAIRATQDGLPKLVKPDGAHYAPDYYRNLASTINHIPTVGEGMAMVDLAGLRVEPVVFGIRHLIDQGPLELYIANCLAGLADNRGSSFRGPRSFFYEAQETLRSSGPEDHNAKRRRREEITRYLLSLKDDVGEVIYYEAADWTYYLSFSDLDLCEHRFLDQPAVERSVGP